MKNHEKCLPHAKSFRCHGMYRKVSLSHINCVFFFFKFLFLIFILYISIGSDSIEKPYLNNMLGKHLASNLCATLRQYEILTKREDIDIDKVLNSKTIKEFDTYFTSKHFGYRDVDHYYSMATLHNKLHMISVPLLCLSAADDPFQPLEGDFVVEH